MKTQGQQEPEGLCDGKDPGPDSSLVCIIGRPAGEAKSTDACAVIPQDQREEKYLEHIQARAADRRGA